MKLLEVKLVSSGLAELHQFYAETLGLSVFEPDVLRHDEVLRRDSVRLSLQIGTSRLSFEAGVTQPGPYHLAFDVPEHRFEEAQTWLRSKTCLLEKGGQNVFFSEEWNAHMVYFSDPDGNILELIARHTRPSLAVDSVAAPFGPHHLLNISEVGLAVPDVQATLRQIEETLGVTEYLSSTPSFGPAGTHDGLCILVSAGRPWFPTGQPALPLPVKIFAQTPKSGVLPLSNGLAQINGV